MNVARERDPAAFMLERARVALSGGAPFGVGGGGHARLNFATPAPILTEVVERIGAAVSDGRWRAATAR